MPFQGILTEPSMKKAFIQAANARIAAGELNGISNSALTAEGDCNRGS